VAWNYEFYVEADGSIPVRAFLESLSSAEFGKMAQVFELLKSYGPTLPFPWSSQIRGRLRELRCHFGRRHIRILYYCDSRRVFILLHGLHKAAAALDRRDVALAEKRMLRDQRLKEAP
jgi:hypothetical protein